MNAAVASQCVAPARIMRPVAPRVATTARCAHIAAPRAFNTMRCNAAAEAPVAPVTNAAEPSYDAPAATYAVVDIGGHQLIVEEGRWYTVNRLDVPDGSVIELGRVLALKHNGEFKVGQPYLDGVKVTAEILGEEKGDKVIVYKMKPKKHYRRTNGHRQPLTKFLVTKIAA